MYKSILTAAVALVALTGSAFAQAFPISAYYPLKVGSKWSYNDSATGENFVLHAAETVNINGHTAMKLVRIGNTDVDVISNDASGILVHGRNFKGTNATYNPPVVFAPAAVTLNATQVTNPNFKNPATGNNTIWTTRFDTVEDIAVPAGKYPKCARLELVIKDEKLGTILAKMNMWLAPNVGMVKRQGQFFGVFYVQQLTAVTL